ncbi:MAG: hypothetical protein AAB652_00025 [Patescibacteria group bacterium]|mgnify:CR=1 FL=1
MKKALLIGFIILILGGGYSIVVGLRGSDDKNGTAQKIVPQNTSIDEKLFAHFLIDDGKCRGVRNDLYAIDEKVVAWIVNKPCPPVVSEVTLWEGNPSAANGLLCTSIATKPDLPQCQDTQYESLYGIIRANIDKKDLGLGASHSIRKITYSTEELAVARGDVNQLSFRVRDSTRFSDLGSLKSAINLYISEGNKLSGCGSRTLYKSNIGTKAYDGTGWLPVNLKKIISGSPFNELPIDPVNDANYYFVYVCNSATNQYELNVNLQGDQYGMGGSRDKESTDGGNNPDVYELGTDLSLLQ